MALDIFGLPILPDLISSSLLFSQGTEFEPLVLNCLITSFSRSKPHFVELTPFFFVKYTDSEAVMSLKIHFLCQLISEGNLEDILAEIQTYLFWEQGEAFCKLVTQELIRISNNYPRYKTMIARGLISAVDAVSEPYSEILTEALTEVIQERSDDFPRELREEIALAGAAHLPRVHSFTAKAALLSLLYSLHDFCPLIYPDLIREIDYSAFAKGEDIRIFTMLQLLFIKMWNFHFGRKSNPVSNCKLRF